MFFEDHQGVNCKNYCVKQQCRKDVEESERKLPCMMMPGYEFEMTLPETDNSTTVGTCAKMEVLKRELQVINSIEQALQLEDGTNMLMKLFARKLTESNQSHYLVSFQSAF